MFIKCRRCIYTNIIYEKFNARKARMKKWFYSILFLLFSSSLFADPINNIVFLGDSLSDNGNIYQLLLHILPKSPPYFQGRFSNGPTWAERVGQNYYQQYYINYENYAYGGATAILHMPNSKFIAPTILPIEVDKYLIDHLFSSKAETLFAIWIGGNDYIFTDNNIDQEKLTDQVIAGISAAISNLINHGATKFLILNLPDLGKVPYAGITNTQERLSTLTQLHNEKLAREIELLKRANPTITFMFTNIYKKFNDVLLNPTKYNDKYHVHLQNTHDACWQGGYLLKNPINKLSLQKDIQAAMASGNGNNKYMTAEITNFILANPILASTYQSGKMYEQGFKPCDNADGYIFWDGIHPSAVVHQVIALMVEKEIDKTLFANH